MCSIYVTLFNDSNNQEHNLYYIDKKSLKNEKALKGNKNFNRISHALSRNLKWNHGLENLKNSHIPYLVFVHIYP